MAFSLHFVKSAWWIVPGVVALGLAGCSPSTNSAADNEATGNNATGNNTSNNSGTANATPTGGSTGNEAANSAVIAATPSSQAPPKSALANVWVPGKDGQLHLKPVSKTAMDVQKKFKDPTEAFNDIVRQSPTYFPPKTRVLDWHFDGKAVSLNFNRAFVDTNFWSKLGEERTRLAVYALVNSAANSAGAPKPVTLEVEKSPIQTVGALDTEGLIEPNRRLETTIGGYGNTMMNADKTGHSEP